MLCDVPYPKFRSCSPILNANLGRNVVHSQGTNTANGSWDHIHSFFLGSWQLLPLQIVRKIGLSVDQSGSASRKCTNANAEAKE
ncbi:hypothetical protein VTJ04DRAFT_2095 [Mycothermus thermophilus]|uniref:uncharacterized protein n=1 Tax=Humicola insolens TaxID=85995 RepID=UPI003743887B